MKGVMQTFNVFHVYMQILKRKFTMDGYMEDLKTILTWVCVLNWDYKVMTFYLEVQVVLTSLLPHPSNWTWEFITTVRLYH